MTHTIKPMRKMNPKATSIAQLFQAKGYRTAMVGKWHLELSGRYHPSRRGFDETLTCIDDNYKTSQFNPTLLHNLVEKKHQGYRTDILFNSAMDFIKRNEDGPFFVYLATHSPHSPHRVPKRYSLPYDAFKGRYSGKRYSSGFFGMTANVDEKLGKLMDCLKEHGLDDNTLLMVMNDNGGTGGVDVFNGGRRGVKGTIWSGGTRAYSFWKWDDRFAPGNRPQMVGHVDVLPTLADLCGLEVPEHFNRRLVCSSPDRHLGRGRHQGRSSHVRDVAVRGRLPGPVSMASLPVHRRQEVPEGALSHHQGQCRVLPGLAEREQRRVAGLRSVDLARERLPGGAWRQEVGGDLRLDL